MSVDQSRVAEVMAVAFGSGFRVAPRLVLTSGHVTGPVSDRPLRLRFLEDDTVIEGRVVWQRDDSWLDAALIELDGAEPAPRPPVRFGRFTGSSRRAGCEIWGFPRGLQRPFREVVQLAGTINPGTLGIGRRHQITLSDAVPRKGVEADRSPWQGVSGGPVFSDDGLLIGIVEHDPVEYDSDVLEAVPLVELIRDPGFRETVERHLDGPLRLESVELGGLLAQPVPQPLNSPGFLIRAETEAVRFRGRTGILDDLIMWCTGTGTSVRLLTGPGGRGKTRLARRLASSLPTREWVSGFVGRGAVGASEARALTDVRVPTLLIVDYAETRVEAVQALLSAAAANPSGAAIRILLIARAAGDWWRSLCRGSEEGRALCTPEPTILAALEESPDGRRAAFEEALSDFAALLGRVDGYGGQDWPSLAAGISVPDLTDGSFHSVLAIHMTALTALLQTGAQPPHVGPGSSAADTLLAHEETYWERTARSRDLSLDAELKRRAVAAAALCGAPDETSARALLKRVVGLRDATEATTTAVAGWLAAVYPAPPGTFFGPLQPDVLGEHLIGEVTARSEEFLLSLLPTAVENQTAQALHVLSRACAHQDHLPKLLKVLLTAHPDALADAAVRVAPQAQHPQPLIDALESAATSATTPLAVIERIEALIPQETGFLAECAVAFARRAAVDNLLQVGEDAAAFQQALWRVLNLADRLAHVGRHAEAAAHTAEVAHTVGKQLAVAVAVADADADADSPFTDIHWLLLGMAALGRHADALSHCGEHDSAVTKMRAVVEIGHRLPQGTGLARLGLAVALGALARLLSVSGEHVEAEANAREAVELLRQLVADSPLLADELAAAQMRLGSVLFGAGRSAEAAQARREAEQLLTELGSEHPQPLLRLASVKTELAWASETEGRSQEAHEALRESAEIYERLADSHPDIGLSYHVSAQQRLAEYLVSRVAAPEQAIPELERAAVAARQLARTATPARLGALGAVLLRLVTLRFVTGQMADSEPWVQECVEVHRRLLGMNADDDASLNRALSTSLVHLGDLAFDGGRVDSAADAYMESASLILVLSHPTQQDLVRLNAAVAPFPRLVLLERTLLARALDLAERALALARTRAAEQDGDVGSRALASALLHAAALRHQDGQQANALSAVDEALSIIRARSAAGEQGASMLTALVARAAYLEQPDEGAPEVETSAEYIAACRQAYDEAVQYVRRARPQDMEPFVATAVLAARAMGPFPLLSDAMRVLADAVRTSRAATSVRDSMPLLLATADGEPDSPARDALITAALDVFEALAEAPDGPDEPHIALLRITAGIIDAADHGNARQAARVLTRHVIRAGTAPTEEVRRWSAMAHLAYGLAAEPQSPQAQEETFGEVEEAVRSLLPLADGAPQSYLQAIVWTLDLVYQWSRSIKDEERVAVLSPHVASVHARLQSGDGMHEHATCRVVALVEMARTHLRNARLANAELLLEEAVELGRGVSDRLPALYPALLQQLIAVKVNLDHEVSPALWRACVDAHDGRLDVLVEAAGYLAEREPPEAALPFYQEWAAACPITEGEAGQLHVHVVVVAYLAGLGRDADAIAAGAAPLRRARELAVQGDTVARWVLADLGALLIDCHCARDEPDELLTLADEVLPLLRDPATRPSAQRGLLVEVLLNSAWALTQLDRPRLAADRLVEAHLLARADGDLAAHDEDARENLALLFASDPDAARKSWQAASDDPLPDWLRAPQE